MDSQHPNSNTKRLLGEQESSSPESQQHPEEDSSDVRRRDRNISDSNSSNQPNLSRSTNKQAKPKVSRAYQVNMALQVCTYAILTCFLHLETKKRFFSRRRSFGSDQFDFIISLFALVQSIFALYAAFQESLKYIQKALIMMKIFAGLLTLSIVTSISKESPLSRSISLGIFIPCVLLPTIATRNTLQSASKNNNANSQDSSEKKRDPIKKLDSWGYIIYKYWILIAFCLHLTLFVSSLWEAETERKFSVTWVTGSLADFCFSGSLVLIFEGIRKKHLIKIERAIKLHVIQASYVLGLMSLASSYLDLKDFGPVVLAGYPEILEAFGPFGTFLVDISILSVYVLVIFGACKVRDVLKEHEKERHRL